MNVKKTWCLALVMTVLAACNGSGSLILEDDETGALYGAILADEATIATYPKGIGPWASLEATPSPTATPTSVLLSNTPPIQQQGACSLCEEQGSPGSCISWSAAYGLGSYTANLTQQWGVDDPDHQVSAAYMYAYVLNQESRKCPTGTMEAPYLNFLVRNGAPSMTTVPYQPDCLNYLDHIDLGTVSDPSFKIGSWSYVSPQDRDLIKSYLAAGHAVAFAGHLYDGFGLLQGSDVFYGSGPFEVNKKTGKLVGHGMMLIGYNDNLGDPTQGLGAYRIQNSFGTNWGDSGYLWMSYDTFEKSIVSAFVAEPLAATISGGVGLVPDAASAPDGRVTRAYQWASASSDGTTLAHLVFRHQFDAPIELREVRVIDPSGKAARHVYQVWHQNGYTHLTRRDGRQFLDGNYLVEIRVGLADGSTAQYSAEVPIAALGASALPESPFASGLLGGNGQVADLE